MLDALKTLFENDVVSDEVRTQIEEAPPVMKILLGLTPSQSEWVRMLRNWLSRTARTASPEE